MKKTAIIIGTLVILTGGVFVALQPNQVIPPQRIIDLDFSPVDFAFSLSDTRVATSTDEQGNEVRIAIIIPVKYDFPIATASGYIIEQIEEDVGMTLDGYNSCRFSGKIKTVCLAELDDQILQVVNIFKRGKVKELEELQRRVFAEELTF